MTTLFSVMSGLQKQVANLTTGLVVGGTPITVETGIGWPAVNALQNVARAANSLALVTIYDRKVGRDTTRWLPYTTSEITNAAGITSAISNTSCPFLGSVVVTLSGTPNLNDGLSFVANLIQNGKQGAAAIIRAAAGDTLATMATKLAAAIMAEPTLSQWFRASASGAQVTVTSLLASNALIVASYTGANGSVTTEVGRRERQFQITAWTRTELIRQAVTDPIDSYLSLAQVNFGPTLDDGTPVRLTVDNDFYLEDDTLEDVYRRDFLLRIEYPITSTDVLYAVLAPILAFELG